MYCFFLFFFFQAEDGIRDSSVTGVQTCALPISRAFPDPASTNCPGWSFGCRLRPLPPAFRERSRQGCPVWSFYPIPPRNPFLGGVEHWNSVEASHQGTVQCADRRDKFRPVASPQQRRDHGVDGRTSEGTPRGH